MMLAIYLQRRLYVSGYGYLWQNVELPEFAKDRLRSTLKFSQFSGGNDLAKMSSDGVHFFILDKSINNSTRVPTGLKTLLSSGRFELIELPID